MNWSLIAAQYALGLIAPRDLPGLAYQMLQSSDDPQSVIDLAVLPPDDDTTQIERVFGLVLEDLHVKLPSADEAIIEVATHLAREVVERRIPTYAGACQIADLSLYREGSHFYQLLPLYCLVHEYMESELKESVYVDQMFAECRRLLTIDRDSWDAASP
jgi:hypothetical protein